MQNQNHLQYSQGSLSCLACLRGGFDEDRSIFTGKISSSSVWPACSCSHALSFGGILGVLNAIQMSQVLNDAYGEEDCETGLFPRTVKHSSEFHVLACPNPLSDVFRTETPRLPLIKFATCIRAILKCGIVKS
ncbi:hypothetical protein RHSIM_Rhsim07G0043200 [Rhododendron simsii]|uniref:Uncharacterized protein n=1 Tax=Rhododendron simsii TaxID=118357 RepID=A0A834GQC7_RHOSS|nr:hypothetical protein RHSIM_Rhsim07G0043200 [Rhododendron simsii]